MWRILSKAYLGWNDLLSQVKTVKNPQKLWHLEPTAGRATHLGEMQANIGTCVQASEVHMWDAIG